MRVAPQIELTDAEYAGHERPFFGKNFILKKAIEATENTEQARVSRKITGHPNGDSVTAHNPLFLLCDLCG